MVTPDNKPGQLRLPPGLPTGGQLGHFALGPSLKEAPSRPLEYLFIRSIIEQSDLDTLIEQSQYSSEEQCGKLINKEIWLVRGSYYHCQYVMTFSFFLSLTYGLGEVVIQSVNLLAPGAPL